MTAQPLSPSLTPEQPTPVVSFDDYMTYYAHDFYEWVNGELIKISPLTLHHDQIVKYLRILLEVYFSLRDIGIVIGAPFVMKLDPTRSGREPDLQVILKTNSGELSETAMLGPADICIEVVSEESVSRDYGDKFREYEAGGVTEYWLLDPLRRLPYFYRLGDEGRYTLIPLDDHERYSTPLLTGLYIHVPTLWTPKLPNALETTRAVQTMLGDSPL